MQKRNTFQLLSLNWTQFFSRSRHYNFKSGPFSGLGPNTRLPRLTRKQTRADPRLDPRRQHRTGEVGLVRASAGFARDLGDGGPRVRHRPSEEPAFGADDELGFSRRRSLHAPFRRQRHLAGLSRI